MITDPRETYNLDLDHFLTLGFPTDEAVRLADQCAERRASLAQKADTAKWCLYLGTFLVIGVLGVAVFTVTR